MRFFRPGFLAGLYPEAKFRIKTTEKILYLTFDDGPDPQSTPFLLEILKKHSIRVLFFCIGENAEEHPELINQILNDSHEIGNHTYNHADGWRTNSVKYIDDVIRASKSTSSLIFRPPFGRIRPKQYRILKRQFLIVFWDLMAYDFDSTFNAENSLNLLKTKIRPGSIIVLHDTSSSTARFLLDEFLTFATEQGFRFEMMSQTLQSREAGGGSYARNNAASVKTFSNQ
jgi:peptidoglycan/xylan/chitin deacetylase (PgdA/CDA1 family)